MQACLIIQGVIIAYLLGHVWMLSKRIDDLREAIFNPLYDKLKEENGLLRDFAGRSAEIDARIKKIRDELDKPFR